MKKWDLKKRFQVNIDDLDDRLLLINLYATQAITLIIGVIVIWLQGQSWTDIYEWTSLTNIALWGGGLAAAVLVADILITRFVPDDVTDDGGVNQRLFGKRPLWHIVVMSLIVAVCEETLFRGAIQQAFGPYWTSILFAAIHVRYLRHWLMTGMVFAISYAMGWVYIRTGTLWAPIAAHWLIDLVMGCILRYRKEEE